MHISLQIPKLNRMNRIYPEWRVNSEFITDHLNQALKLDSKISSHPVEVDCPDANNINQVNNSYFAPFFYDILPGDPVDL